MTIVAAALFGSCTLVCQPPCHAPALGVVVESTLRLIASLRESISATNRSVAIALARWLAINWENDGAAIIARTPKMATTVSISTTVKPAIYLRCPVTSRCLLHVECFERFIRLPLPGSGWPLGPSVGDGERLPGEVAGLRSDGRRAHCECGWRARADADGDGVERRDRGRRR